MQLNERVYQRLSEKYGIPKKEITLLAESAFEQLRDDLAETTYGEVRLIGLGAFKAKYYNHHFRSEFMNQSKEYIEFYKPFYIKHLKYK